MDGNEYYDSHNGFGAMVQGHANPEIGKAIADRFPKGTHFALPDEDDFVVADELTQRFGLPKWRFTNSGSEATMDAIRIARAYTHRDPIMKIFGSYHGHHDAVMVSIVGDYENIGDKKHLKSIPYGAGIPKSRRCARSRSATAWSLIFDEVKTGLTIGPGGATKLFGVTPDLVTMAKAISGGLPMGAIGGTEEVMSVVESGEVYQVGTYSGNPLCVAAARANLEKVLTPEAYRHFDELSSYLMEGCGEVVKKYGFPGYSIGFGAKGCVTFSPHKIVDYVTFKQGQRTDLNQLCWLYAMNNGVFMTPGREEEWTLSVAHDKAACDAYIGAFEKMAHDVTSD